MDNRNGLIIFSIFVLLFAFTFVFGWNALLEPYNVFFGILALVGYLVVVFGSLANGLLIQKDGGALSVWYFAFTIITAVVMVWYFTRCGTAFGWWT